MATNSESGAQQISHKQNSPEGGDAAESGEPADSGECGDPGASGWPPSLPAELESSATSSDALPEAVAASGSDEDSSATDASLSSTLLPWPAPDAGSEEDRPEAGPLDRSLALSSLSSAVPAGEREADSSAEVANGSGEEPAPASAGDSESESSLAIAIGTNTGPSP